MAGSLDPELLPRAGESHWRWRERMALHIAGQMDAVRLGVAAFYLMGSTKNATAGPASDIDLIVHFRGSEAQRAELLRWLDGWSQILGEINRHHTGCQTGGLLDVHIVTDAEIAQKTSYAVRIGAVTDPARPLKLGKHD